MYIYIYIHIQRLGVLGKRLGILTRGKLHPTDLGASSGGDPNFRLLASGFNK